MLPEREPLAVPLPAQLLVRPWVVPSAQSRGLPWEAWPELRLDTRSVKRSIRRRKENWRQNLKNRLLVPGNPNSAYEAAYHYGLENASRSEYSSPNLNEAKRV